MKLGIRTLAATAALITLIAAGASYWAGQQLGQAGHTAAAAHATTFKSYRVAQSLKALAAGHELTMNEFYSTVLAFPSYQKKVAAQKAAIDGELAMLADLKEGDAAAVAALTRNFEAMEGIRRDLESAMTAEETDWDGAREALFKLNVLSVQAIQQADFLGQSASDRAAALETARQARQSQAQQSLHLSLLLTLLAAGLLVYGVVRTKS